MQITQRQIEPPLAGSREWFAPAAPAPQDQTTRIFDVSDLFSLLARSRRLIAFTIAATTAAAAIIGFASPKKYRATAEVFVDARGFRVLNSEVTQFNGIDTVNSDFETQIRIMTSGQVLRRVVERENLATDGAFISQPGMLSRIKGLLGGQRETISDRIGYSVALLEKMVTARRSERSYVVDLAVTDTDGVRAARIAQAIAETYLETQAANRRDLTRRLGTEVSARLQDLRERLDAAEKRLAAYKRDNNLIYSEGRLVSDRDLTALNDQLNQARARTARARARLEQLRRMSASAAENMNLAEVLDSPAIVQLRVKLAETTRQLAELRRNLGPRHPEILAHEARANDARGAISSEIGRRRTALSNEMDQALAAERALSRQIETMKRQSGDTNSALIPLRELERSVEANKKVYEEFLVRARELTEQQGVVANGSAVITNATAPTIPVGLSLPVIIALGFFAGIPLGVGMAFARDQLSPKASRQKTMSGEPAQAPVTSGVAGLQSAPAAQANVIKISLKDVDGYIEAGCLEKVTPPPEQLAQAARSIEAFTGNGSNELIVVASSDPSAATHSIALALAACWAWDGYETAAIDADARRGRLAREAGLFGKPGLFDRYHRDVMEFVEWKRKGLAHLLGALPASQQQTHGGARRFVSQRLEDLTQDIEIVIADAGVMEDNEFGQTLAQASTLVIAVVDGEHATAPQWLSQQPAILLHVDASSRTDENVSGLRRPSSLTRHPRPAIA